jgi:hypothetical protein
MVHGFGHQGKDGMLHHLFPIRKHNFGILVHDQTPQPLTPHNINMHLTFSNKKQQIFHELLLL